MKYKLLVVDIDGTLLGRERTISAENKEALDKARKSGIGVALSTGRAVLACRDILDQLALDGHHHRHCDVGYRPSYRSIWHQEHPRGNGAVAGW